MASSHNNSPFPTPRYPSQSADYISLESGGPNRNNFKMQQQQNYKARDSPYAFNYRNNNRNYGRSDFHQNKRKHFNNTPKNSEYDFFMYFHPSMLQDPWEHLVKRHEALCASKIDTKEAPNE